MKQKFATMMTVLLMLFLASTAFAAIPSDVSDSKYIKTYVRGTQNVSAYRDSSLRTRGNSRGAYNAAVYPTDEIRIYQMDNSVARIGYIAGKSWVTAYIPTSAITTNNSSRDGQRFSSGIGKGNVFARSNGTVYSGSAIDSGDTVWRLAEENGYSQVVYPAGSVYKMAWIRTSDYNSRVGGRVVPTPTPNPIVNPVTRPNNNTVASITNGDYYLVPEANGGFALDVKGGGDAPEQTPLQLYNRHGEDAQIFTIQSIGGGWYTIKHKRTGRCVNVSWGSPNNGTGLWLYRDDGTASCHWRFLDAGNGSYNIQSRLSGNPILELQNNNVYAGGRIQLWQKHNGQAGRWKLVKVTSQQQTGGFQPYQKTATQTVPAYRDAGLSNRTGNERVDAGDVVTILRPQVGEAFYVRYPAGNTTKDRWVHKNVFEPISSKLEAAMNYIASLEGRAMDYDGAYGAQCVDLVKYYYHYLGVAGYARGDGKDYATNALPPGWIRIKGAEPQRGDILVYTTGENGHVAIAESSTVSWHQNYKGVKRVQKIPGNYRTVRTGYWGVIRPAF